MKRAYSIESSPHSTTCRGSSAVVKVRYWPIAADRGDNFSNSSRAANRRERSFKDGLTEQMNSFDECRLSPISGSSDHVNLYLATGRVRPEADIQIGPSVLSIVVKNASTVVLARSLTAPQVRAPSQMLSFFVSVKSGCTARGDSCSRWQCGADSGRLSKGSEVA